MDSIIADKPGPCCASQQVDINNDTKTNILDIIATLIIILNEQTSTPLVKCSVDLINDDLINVLDVILLTNETLDDSSIF